MKGSHKAGKDEGRDKGPGKGQAKGSEKKAKAKIKENGRGRTKKKRTKTKAKSREPFPLSLCPTSFCAGLSSSPSMWTGQDWRPILATSVDTRILPPPLSEKECLLLLRQWVRLPGSGKGLLVSQSDPLHHGSWRQRTHLL